MKLNLPNTRIEQPLTANTVIISTTDPKGIITSVNEDFIRISGFTETELLGSNHNVVRHSDMPPAAFEDLWRCLKQDQPWMGIVKNRSRNGDHYWVDAYVAPVHEEGRHAGYQSVRTRPDRATVARAEKIYERINRGKVPLLLRWRVDYVHQLFVAFIAVIGSLVALLIGSGAAQPGLALHASTLVSIVLAYGCARFMGLPVRRQAAHARALVDNPLMQLVYTGRTDEFGQIAAAMHMLMARLRTLTGRMDEVSDQLEAIAGHTSRAAGETEQGMRKQLEEVELLVTAMHQMHSSVHHIAESGNNAASASRSADDAAQRGAALAAETIGSINALTAEIERAGAVVSALGEKSDAINAILEVIRAIAEQTNLLALNAAIEAARAGEQGRGFSVVADEVRSLANRSRQSTEDIRTMIEQLQTGVKNAVAAMAEAEAKAQHGSEKVEFTAKSLAEIAGEVATINQMNVQVAAAAEQQSKVAEEINRGLLDIRDVAERAAAGAHDTAQASALVNKTVSGLKVAVRQCGLDHSLVL